MLGKKPVLAYKTESNDRWQAELYKQGSEACRNYSQLTMRTRTLSQEVLLVSVVGLSAVITKVDASAWPQIVLAAGIALLPFSVSLAFVDWHYQSAFSAIRNFLADIEVSHKQNGPWRAHLKERTHFKDHIASYGPFLLLSAIGCLAIMVGTWSLADPKDPKITAGQFYPAMFAALLVAVWLFWVSFRLNQEASDDLENLRKKPRLSRVDRCFLNVVCGIRRSTAYWVCSLVLIATSIYLGFRFPTRSLMCIHVLFLLLLWVCFFVLMCWLAARKDGGRLNQNQ